MPVDVTDAMLDRIHAMLPELPVTRRHRFVADYGLTHHDAETILGHRPTADLFERVIADGGPSEIVGKQFINVWLRLANDRGRRVTDLGVDTSHMAELAGIVADGTVNKTVANRLAEVMLQRTESPEKLALEFGLIQVRDTAATQAWVEQAWAANEKAVQDAVENPKKTKAATGFLRGQVMKISRGQADPMLVGELIEQRLAALRGKE